MLAARRVVARMQLAQYLDMFLYIPMQNVIEITNR